MKIIKGRSGKSRLVSKHIQEFFEAGKKVVIFDTVGVDAFAFDGNCKYFLFDAGFHELAANFNHPDFASIIKNVDLFVFYANTRDAELELIREQPFKDRVLITVQTDLELEIIEE